MNKRLFIIALIILPNSIFGFDMENYIQQNKNQKLNIFLENFPYVEYLKTTAFTDFTTIQSHRYLVYKNIYSSNGGQDGDGFVYYLANTFLSKYPITNSKELEDNILIGEQYIDPNKKLSNTYQPNLDNNSTYKLNTNESFKTIGYFILSRVAEKIKQDYKAGNFDRNTTINKGLLNRLESNKVYVSFEESQSTKLVQNIKKGKFSYIWDRIKIKAQPYFCGKWQYFMWGLIIILIILLFAEIHAGFKTIFFIIALVLTIFQFSIKCNNKPTQNQTQTASPNFRQIPFTHFYSTGNNEYLVDIYSLKNKTTTIGHSIWIKRPNINAKYFAYNANSQFQNLQTTNKIIFAAAGGYSTDIGNGSIKPDGFTVQEGNMVNPVILHDRHALVMFTDGGIRLLNLNSDKIILPNNDEIESPLTSILAYSKLLKWSAENKATIFQTHLLAFSDSLLINPNKAKIGDRERRILAIVRDIKNQTVYHALFDITVQYDLATASQEIFNIITSRGFKVEGIVNLDTGTYNIFNIFDERGTLLSNPIGPVKIQDATNLIVYYK